QFERYDGLRLAELIRTKEATPEEVLAATLERIDGRNPAINAVVTRMDDHARAAIRAGLPDGPFKGVPYLLKDLGALYTGVVTSYGSGLFASNVPDHDSEIVARMKRAGLVIVGKSNTPEMGIAPSTAPRCWMRRRVPTSAIRTGRRRLRGPSSKKSVAIPDDSASRSPRRRGSRVPWIRSARKLCAGPPSSARASGTI